MYSSNTVVNANNEESKALVSRSAHCKKKIQMN